MRLLFKAAMGCYSSVFLACFVLLFSVGCSYDDSVSDTSYKTNASKIRKSLLSPDTGGVMVVAHRGCWREAAENSIAAVEECIKNNIDMIEVDVHQTKDGHLVTIHDDTVDRTTNGSGIVSEMTLQEVRSIRLKTEAGGLQGKLTNWKVPLLEEILLAAKGKILINLDVKEEIYGEALTVVENLNMVDQVLIKMVALPDDDHLRSAAFLGKTHFMPIVRQCRPEKPGMICSVDLSDVLPEYKEYSPVAYEIVFHDEEYLIDGISEIKKQHKRLWVNTLQKHHAAGHMDLDAVADPDAHWGYLIALGVDIIQTDNPVELIQYLEVKGFRK